MYQPRIVILPEGFMVATVKAGLADRTFRTILGSERIASQWHTIRNPAIEHVQRMHLCHPLSTHNALYLTTKSPLDAPRGA